MNKTIMITRFSSRRQALGTSFINEKLKDAVSYDRIAGFFRSSLLEVAGEQLEAMAGKIRIVCNSDIDQRDIGTAKAAQQAMRKSWCSGEPERLGEGSKDRFSRLYDLLTSDKLEVRVMPDKTFGLIHGKAGVISYKNGRKTSFMGSANESLTAWKLNYEIVWEDDSKEGVDWVQEEFDTLWFHPDAIPLSDFVVKDIRRLAQRQEIQVAEWKGNPVSDPAAGVVETPVYRKNYGLWAHQKYFIKLAYEAHKRGGARFVLADQVGLGKTVQLALSAMLMVLQGEKPVLILVPKPLTLQWQDELRDLLGVPSARWTGREWIDEQEIIHPATGPESIRKCPRRIGIVSQGLISSGSEITEHLKDMRFECIIVDEAHRARRRKVNQQSMLEKPDPNNLMRFLWDISPRTKSLLLATATPVQLHPIEAWDLLSILACDNDIVLGNDISRWRKADETIPVVMGDIEIPNELGEAWRWIRNPLPPAVEGRDFRYLRRKLGLKDTDYVAAGDSLDYLRPPEITRLKNIIPDFGRGNNPFIRHIVRRTRNFLEETIDPSTGESYLKPVRVKLFGEEPGAAILLPSYLHDAYLAAEEFCRLLSQRVRGAGFLKTLLLRRIGSTIYAGRRTTEKMLREWGQEGCFTNSDLFEEEDDVNAQSANSENMKDLTEDERLALDRCLKALDASQNQDPKYRKVVEYLIGKDWLSMGCIIFSQYFDSIWWLAQQLSMELKDETIGIYAGGSNSGIMQSGIFKKTSRDELKLKVSTGDIRLVLGTDAASEGLNLQRLGSLINLDLPWWNPTRLEQRKGRIQRIGQIRDEINVYNMRYLGSVEDRVHELLSSRLEDIHGLFGQIPDVLEDVWIDVANGEVKEAKKLIESINPKHPFDEKYNRIEDIDWESCATVLAEEDKREILNKGW